MLLGQDLSRRHQGALVTVLDRAVSGGSGYHRLACANIALHQTVHGRAPAEISQYFIDGPALGAGEPEG